MRNKLTIVFSGKVGSGKSSAVNFTLCEYLNRKIGKKRFSLANSKEALIVDHFNNERTMSVEYPNGLTQLYDTYSVKVYSFSDPVKKFCVNTLGLDYAQCNGSVEDKDSPTHICWEDIFEPIREKYSRPRRGSGGIKPASGFMTANEVIKVVENDIFRRVDANCWARSLYSMIHEEGYDLAIVGNAAYPNEVTMGSEIGAKSIRLMRSVHKEQDSMDDFPLGEYSFVLDNSKLTMNETHAKIKGKILDWFQERKIA